MTPAVLPDPVLAPRTAGGPRHRRRPRRAGFTLVEMMMALAIGSVTLAAALAGIVSLQRAYAATEQYSVNLADQARLLDCLGMDLRRARSVQFDADGNGMTLTLPDYYNFGPKDPQRVAPLPNLPRIPDDHSRAVYTAAANDPNQYGTLPLPAVYYHFDAKAKTVTREEMPPASASAQQPTNRPPASTASVYGMRTLAVALQGFPVIQLLDDQDTPLGPPNTTPPAGATPVQASIAVCFKPLYQTVSTPDTNLIRLHAKVLLRNNDVHSH